MSRPVSKQNLWLAEGRWYYLVVVFSFGVLAAIPFWHAFARARRRTLLRLALLYTAADVAIVVLASLVPRNAAGDAVGTAGNALENAYVVLALVVLVAACIQYRSVRRQAFGIRPRPPADDDPAVARALQARARREESRAIAAKDPALARELGIGRPDLRRGYDDGGLVDLNSADSALIAAVAGIPLSDARAIVAAREAQGGCFLTVEDVFVDTALPEGVQQQVREHAFL